MKLWKIIFAQAGAAMMIACSGEQATEENTLWYTTPATAWEEALPVGNGRLGAMVFGYRGTERIQFNENTLYSGGPQPDLGIDIRKDLGTVRRLLGDGKNAEAGELIQKNWIGRLNEAYQPFGDVYIDMGDSLGISGYRHSLDMENAIVTTSYRKDGATIKREVFASYPDQAIVIHIEADRPVLDFTAYTGSVHPVVTCCENGEFVMKGHAPAHAQRRDIANMREFHTERLHPEYFDKDGNVIRDDRIIYGTGPDGMGMKFESVLVPFSYKDGSLTATDRGIRAEGCSEVTLLLYAATGFNGFDKSPSLEGKDPHAEIAKHRSPLAGTTEDRAADAAGKTADDSRGSYTSIKKAHTEDFSRLFNRVSLKLPADEAREKMPTDQRLKAYGREEDPGLVARIFQYGRYLMISGSRPGGQPLNLQGLWNDRLLPPWNSGYTLNINLEMNYWPAEVCNLSECHLPLFSLIREISENGEKIAKDMYGLDGWAIHHNISIWREGYPSDGFVYWFFWNMSGPWLCSHIWEHYLYTGDRDFLAEYYPVMKGAAEFCSGWLVENKDGKLVTPAGTSPENAYLMPDGTPASVCEGSTMDQAIIRNLFCNTIAAAEELDTDEDFRKGLSAKLEKLRGYTTGSDGRILEWDKEYTESEPQHRHISHLFGLYPGNDIAGSEELCEAARKSLEVRGNEGTGWSMAWKTALWARLHDAAMADETLRNLIGYVEPGGSSSTGGGLYRSLLNALPFQIDGNFGITAGVAEMLLQSHNGYIELLPALPESWSRGSVKGLKARGNITVGIDWSGDSVSATLESGSDRTVEVVCGDRRVSASLSAGIPYKLDF